MSDTQTSPTLARSPAVALAQWLAVVGATFAVLGFGMSWVAQTVDVPSPVSVPAAAGPEGAAAGPGGAAGVYPPPDFRLTTLDGGLVGPPDFAGQVVLVELWATWCGPCRAQAKILDELHEEFPDVQFLAVDSGEDEATVRSFVDKTPFPYPVLLDPDDTVSIRYRVTGLPTVMIVDRQGRVSYMQTGISPAATLRRELKAAGAGNPGGATV
jgi:thiol-disulfide isomerase/thioredoxin